jgi:hypothetical protein
VEAAPEIVEELRSREPILHHNPTGLERSAIEARLADDFFEVGASGRIYDREQAVELVVERFERDDVGIAGEVEDFRVSEIAPHTFIATYTLHTPDGHAVRTTRRATVWSNAAGHWQVHYHQGTIVPAG